jgi:hypothetical protein
LVADLGEAPPASDHQVAGKKIQQSLAFIFNPKYCAVKYSRSSPSCVEVAQYKWPDDLCSQEVNALLLDGKVGAQCRRLSHQL